MYRFKTEKEFQDEFGEDFRRRVKQGWNINMDYLFGKTITKYEWDNIQSSGTYTKKCFGDDIKHIWIISKDMVKEELTSNLLDCHGYEFEATIEGRKIKGKVTVEYYDNTPRVYLCQDVRTGISCENKQGYKYSWGIIDDTYEKQLEYIQEIFKNFKLLNKSIYDKISIAEVCNSYSQGEPRGTTVGIHSKPIAIARGSRFVGREATNFYVGTTACKGKISYNRLQSV